jgi:hypothetical protein
MHTTTSSRAQGWEDFSSGNPPPTSGAPPPGPSAAAGGKTPSTRPAHCTCCRGCERLREGRTSDMIIPSSNTLLDDRLAQVMVMIVMRRRRRW